MIKVVHCRQAKYDVLIDRTTKWGNPFIVGKYGTRAQCIKKFEEYLIHNERLMESLHELKDKTLGCWCHPKPCHGDILKKYTDRLQEKNDKEKTF